MNELASYLDRHKELSKAKERARVLGEGLEQVETEINEVTTKLKADLQDLLVEKISEKLPPLTFDPSYPKPVDVDQELVEVLDLVEIEEGDDDAIFVVPVNDETEKFHNHLSNYYYLTGDETKAASIYENLLEIARKSTFIYNLSVIRSSEQIYTNALDLIEEIAVDDSSWELYNNRGYIYDKLGRKEEALANYSSASELTDDDEANYLVLVNTASTLKHFGDSGAITAFNQIISEYEDKVFPLAELGDIYAHKGQYDEALKYYQMAADKDPSVDILYDLSTLLMINEQFDGAVGLLSRLVEREQSPRIHNSLGVALLRKEERDEAREHFERALELDSEYSKAKDNLVALDKKTEPSK